MSLDEAMKTDLADASPHFEERLSSHYGALCTEGRLHLMEQLSFLFHHLTKHDFLFSSIYLESALLHCRVCIQTNPWKIFKPQRFLVVKKIFPRVRCKELIWMVRRAQRWPIPDTIALPMQLKAMRSHCKRHSTQIHFNSQNFDAIFSSWPLTTLALQGALKWMSRSGRQTIFLQFSGETLCRDNCQLIGIVFLVIHLY